MEYYFTNRFLLDGRPALGSYRTVSVVMWTCGNELCLWIIPETIEDIHR